MSMYQRLAGLRIALPRSPQARCATRDVAAVHSETWAVVFVFSALFASGMAAIINQTVWQRALKVYLAGSESISSMIIVLVFMLGLGAGSLVMGMGAHRVKNPLRALALVEAALFLVNVLISVVLSLDIAENVYAFQRFAVSAGLPLRVMYGLSAGAVLLVPCFLMGVTMPLASEVAQRQLRCETSSFVAVLFTLNTLGSVAGGIAAGFLFLPFFGQMVALWIGAACNVFAAMLLYVLYRVSYPAGDFRTTDAAPAFRTGKLSREEVCGFWLGFLSLAYEMYLFRVASLAHWALPYNFCLVLVVLSLVLVGRRLSCQANRRVAFDWRATGDLSGGRGDDPRFPSPRSPIPATVACRPIGIPTIGVRDYLLPAVRSLWLSVRKICCTHRQAMGKRRWPVLWA